MASAVIAPRSTPSHCSTPLFAAREREQRLDEVLLRRAEGQQLLARRSQRRDARVRVGERDLKQGPFGGQGRPELVGGVCHEVPLGFESGLEAPEEVVEGRAELLELLVRAVEADARVQAAGRDRLGRRRHGEQRAQARGPR